MNEELLNRFSKLIRHHEWWGKQNFAYTQYILWAAVLSSFSASIISGAKVNSTIVAIVAGLPAFTLLIEKVFRYQERASWHDLYATELTSLRDEFAFAEVPANEIVRRLAKLRNDMERRWPTPDRSAIPQVGSGTESHSDISPSPQSPKPAAQPPDPTQGQGEVGAEP